MQLKRRPNRRAGNAGPIGAQLAAATCALLGTAATESVAAQEIGHWQFDTAGLYYGEINQVRDLSLDVLARTQPAEDRFLDLNFSFDTLSGASPNGAAPSASPQLFVRPVTLTRTSGGGISRSGGNFIVPPGQLPLDHSFQDTRFAGSASWEQPLGRLTLLNAGGSASYEHDYTHLGVDGRIARDLNQRNTTLSAGLAWSDDTVKPIGGAPVAYSPITSSSAAGLFGGDQANEASGSRSKRVLDMLVGWTQVLSPRTIVQVNYSVTRSDGYLTDPYKVLSVVDPISGDLLLGPELNGTGLYLYERRPSAREKRSVYGMIKRDIGGNVVDVSYRRMTDDWGIDSSTVDLHVRFNFADERYLQPHLRFYSQTAANFYHTVLLADQPLPDFATADYRLGAFDAVTYGIKFGMRTRSGNFSTRLELYRQTGSPDPASRVGSLNGLDLYPGLEAVIAQLSYQFGL